MMESFYLNAISIHALRVEGDIIMLSGHQLKSYFYPRPPCGGRQKLGCLTTNPKRISIHALRVEGD